MSRYTSSVFEPEPTPRREDQDPPGYIDLDREGVRDAMNRGLIRPWGSPNGALCLRCGALVAGVGLHDVWHELGNV